MPTGNCRYPEHHSGPGAGAPIGLVAAILAGALIVIEWRTVAVVLAVVAALLIATAAVVMLWHSHTAQPYDAAWSEPANVRGADNTSILQARVDQLERQFASGPAITPPVTHQHLHLHGLAADDLTAIITGQQQAAAWPAIEEDNP